MIIRKHCVLCGKMRGFLSGSERDKQSICGECWDWDKEPSTTKTQPYCARCGDCCRRFLLKLDEKNSKDFKDSIIKAFEKQYPFKLKSFKGFRIIVDGECEHLDGNTCLIYANRPNKCRLFLCKKHFK